MNVKDCIFALSLLFYSYCINVFEVDSNFRLLHSYTNALLAEIQPQGDLDRAVKKIDLIYSLLKLLQKGETFDTANIKRFFNTYCDILVLLPLFKPRFNPSLACGY